ncbi:MAG: hypothetical protein ACI9DM_002725, partial [Cyclobacteriaceae bacterium]
MGCPSIKNYKIIKIEKLGILISSKHDRANAGTVRKKIFH